MKDTYLEVTFRHGRAMAAYYYLPRVRGQRSYRTEELAPEILVDYSRSGRPIGIELTAPQSVSAAKMNRILRRLGQPGLKCGDLAPLRAA
jgi:uncharacterized protein YuzE